MKKLGFATIIASGLAAGVLGIAAPAAQADVAPAAPSLITTGIDHQTWLDVMKVDTSVHQSR
jgi:hypothetical protein